MYGSHDGTRTYVADLVGAKIDKDNIRKIIKNDPNDPGKAMNLTMEFSEFPYNEYDSNGWTRNAWTRIYLCNKKFDIPTKNDIYDWDHLGLTSGFCLKVEGNVDLSSDGTTLTLSSTLKAVEVMVDIMLKHTTSIHKPISILIAIIGIIQVIVMM